MRAGPVAEVRFGIAGHDVSWLDARDPIEESVALNGEIIFETPEFLDWALKPKPYVGGSLNVGGGTSYGGAGLLWRQNAGRFYGDVAMGLTVHDGTLEVCRSDFPISPDATDNKRLGNFLDFLRTRLDTVEYGSRVLFRPQLTVGYRIDDEWAVEGFIEHISHAGLLSDGPNDGSDAAGFRIAKRF